VGSCRSQPELANGRFHIILQFLSRHVLYLQWLKCPRERMLSLRSYIGLVKPKQSLLLAFTGLAAFTYASGKTDLLGALVFFFFGLLATMGSDVLNSFFDANVDRMMKRTLNMPIPRGSVKPFDALRIGVLMVMISTIAFYVFYNTLSAGLVLFGAAYYILLYTIYLKRRTPFSTVIGGLAGAVPVLTGWAAATGTIDVKATLLALIVFLWSPGHFWSLATKHRDDYVKAKLPTLPVVVNIHKSLAAIGGFNLSASIMIILSMLAIPNLIFTIFGSLASILLILATIKILLKPDEGMAWLAFKMSSPALALVFTGLLLSSIA
jgi:protoheme IX farnesyltransferase